MQEEIKEIFNYFIKYANIEDSIKINKLEDYITNLQEENEYSNHCNEELRKKITNLEYKIERLEEDNKNLKQLCDKYEEEHNTTFIQWQKDIKANKKAIEYINHENFKRTILVGVGTKKYTRNILDNVLNILQGVDKE